ncbi:cobalt-precorrin 5A hydrolase [Dysosmobacter sp.]|uniref:cobalt-precorrin 5A hydrolase n=1 Tax=Dysosmobacter sp. TaxID=2591382 RepID=UPI002A956C4C|nr:cobalt-precorrin 5A hydrolase [Dysosmobacter sp.]MDY5612668.1 cobalt-precorrin 5A hydrolase [Dysosmobacter sp.]
MSARRIAYLSFTDRGAALAEQLRAALGGTASCTRQMENFSLSQWTAEAFDAFDALVFVGAVGIAVRAVAPFLKSKAEDPAVVAVDECGRFAVPVVSGHLGGANDLAREISKICGAVAVITTATDANGLFAVDEWAKHQNCVVTDPHGIKAVSARILAGETVRVRSEWPVEGPCPEGVALTDGPDWDARVDVRRHEGGLCLAPRALVLGVGCRKGMPREALETAFRELCAEENLWPEAVCAAATIDLKAEEPGLLDFCAGHGWPLTCYSVEELRRAEGTFTASVFVERTMGVDNVCERSAVCAAGGPLLTGKHAGNGVTMALAWRPFRLDWRWKDA